MPPYPEAPLPLEAAARRATSAARLQPPPLPPPAQGPVQQPALEPPQQPSLETAQRPSLEPVQRQSPEQVKRPSLEPVQRQSPEQVKQPFLEPDPESAGASAPGGRRAARQRVATQRVFSELASLAAIPATSYAVGAEVDGAMCLLQTESGYEVFNAVAGARHEVRLFGDEESAYFYLFGVLAAEAVRTGGLVPHR